MATDYRDIGEAKATVYCRKEGNLPFFVSAGVQLSELIRCCIETLDNENPWQVTDIDAKRTYLFTELSASTVIANHRYVVVAGMPVALPLLLN